MTAVVIPAYKPDKTLTVIADQLWCWDALPSGRTAGLR